MTYPDSPGASSKQESGARPSAGAVNTSPLPVRIAARDIEALLYDGKVEEGESNADNLIESWPEHPEAWMARALVRLRQKRFADAEADARAAIERDPNFAKAYAILGEVLGAAHQWLPSADAWKDALELDPHCFEYRANCGKALVFGGLYGHAASTMRPLIDAGITNEALQNLFSVALALSQSGTEDEIRTHLRKALNFRSDDASLWRMLGHSYLRSKEWQESRKCLLRAVRLDPEDQGARLLMGKALIALGEPERAKLFIGAVAQSVEAMTDLARAERASGNAQAASFVLNEGVISLPLGSVGRDEIVRDRALEQVLIKADLGRREELFHALAEATRLNVSRKQLGFSLFSAFLSVGDLVSAWDWLDHRPKKEFDVFHTADLLLRKWDGSALGSGRILLVTEEKLLLDTLFAIPFLELARERVGEKAKILFVAEDEKLVTLVSQTGLVNYALRPSEAVGLEYAAHAALISLPAILQVGMKAFAEAAGKPVFSEVTKPKVSSDQEEKPVIGLAIDGCFDFRLYGPLRRLTGAHFVPLDFGFEAGRDMPVEKIPLVLSQVRSEQEEAFLGGDGSGRASSNHRGDRDSGRPRQSKNQNSGGDLLELVRTMRTVNLVIVPPGPIAMLSVRMGIPTFLLLPLPMQYQFGQMESSMSWSTKLTPLVATVPGAWDQVIDQAGALLQGESPPFHEPDES